MKKYERKESQIGRNPVILGVNILETTTLPETNIAPETSWLDDYFLFGMAYFQGLCWVYGGYLFLG